ncbi:hypothetical protein [Pseudomonas svalbardensis]|uniref:hypothetical protein n=1 Tax=Pseudomonas svalbardensis TaxID=3042029 RepID=UPI0024B39D9E|nr:hypothetical protein [Pseudomonas sp. PMCC200367]
MRLIQYNCGVQGRELTKSQFNAPRKLFYFPAKRAAKNEEEYELNDENRDAVRKVFVALAAAVNSSMGVWFKEVAV